MIKNNSVSGTTANDHDDRGEGDGIVVYLSHNVDIEENEVDYNDQAGIRITSDKPYGVQEDTTDITVDNNEVENNQYGVLVQDGVKGLSIIENTIDQNEKGVYVEHSNDEDRGAEVAEITGNIISNNDQEGVLVEEWAKVYAIEDNELEGNGSSDPGIDIHTIYPGNVNITGNIIGDSHNFGLYIRNIDDDAGAIKLSIEGNELKDNETGMGFDSIKLSDGGSSLEVKENNYFDNNEDGLHFSENCVFEGIIDRIVIIRNRFEGNNRFGLNNLSGDEIDATENWWGADDGPSGEGGGDAVSEDVLFDPWYMDKEMESLSSD